MARSKGKARGYQHTSAKRARAPSEEDRQIMPDEDLTQVPYTPPLRTDDGAPKLSWQRGDALTDRTLAAPLYIQERIHPSAFVQGLTKESDSNQTKLFDEFNDLPDEAKFRWYQHHGNWSNRLIRGPSLEVMASLLVKDDLAGKVQCIYFDPPYGISFKSLYQQSTRSRDESKDAGSANAEQRIAFRDTYVNGVHTYLDTIHRIASHARELLTESGSFFMQISQENIHRVALVLDEVFGAQSRVATIMFAKTGATSSSTLPQVNDYLLWHCRDREKVKYRQLYDQLDRAALIESFNFDAMLELSDGTERALTLNEREQPDKYIPSGARAFQRMPLDSLGHSTTGRSEPFEWNGRTYPCPSNQHWRVSREGLQRLEELGRLTSAGGVGILRWKRYEDEVPGRGIHNLWGEKMSPSDTRYVVETAESVIARCICMTTDPGDLVFDPTCGSGTTAYVAEKFGRRWITSDVSGISLALTRHRLITAVFQWFVTQGSPEGRKMEFELGGKPATPNGTDREVDPASGFVYPRVPRVSARILAYDEDADPTHLVDQPVKSRESGLRRVSSAFTVETHSPHRYLSLEQAVGVDSTSRDEIRTDVRDRIIAAMQTDGVRLGDGQRLVLVHVTPAAGSRVVTHVARSPGSRQSDTCIAIFGPDETVNLYAERRALNEAGQHETVKTLLLVGFGFEASPELEEQGRIRTYRVQAHQDLRIGQLAPNRQADTLVVIAEPDIEIAKTEQGEWTLEVRGFDSYDPTSGQVADHDGVDEIECMMVDTNYDGSAFFAREIHFPGQGNDRRLKRLKKELGKRVDPDLWRTCLTAKTRPFEPPDSGEVAVRIITSAGAEITAVRDLGDFNH